MHGRKRLGDDVGRGILFVGEMGLLVLLVWRLVSREGFEGMDYEADLD